METPNSITNIYGLVDPRNQTIFYVGRSNSPDKRFYVHKRFVAGSSQPVQLRVQEIRAAGCEPELVILERVNKREAKEAEERWIARFRPTGSLVNQRDACATPRDAFGPDLPAMRPDEMRTIRFQRGWSQAKLAAFLGVHESTVSLWEAGRRRISKPIAKLLRQNT
jgi:DNA-binding transcriptional regulator YiaG